MNITARVLTVMLTLTLTSIIPCIADGLIIIRQGTDGLLTVARAVEGETIELQWASSLTDGDRTNWHTAGQYTATGMFTSVEWPMFIRVSGVFNTNRFYIINGTFTWQAAKVDAESKGGHLATFTTEAEWQEMRMTLGYGWEDSHWLGGYQDPNAPDYSIPDGGWRWVTGETWNYTRWASGEPNGWYNEPQYLGIEWGDPKDMWNDAPQSDPRGYILEYDNK